MVGPMLKRISLAAALVVVLVVVGDVRTVALGASLNARQANLVYVALNGSDNNACTIDAPCATYAHASSLAASLGASGTNPYVVSFSPGTYTENPIRLQPFVNIGCMKGNNYGYGFDLGLTFFSGALTLGTWTGTASVPYASVSNCTFNSTITLTFPSGKFGAGSVAFQDVSVYQGTVTLNGSSQGDYAAFYGSFTGGLLVTNSISVYEQNCLIGGGWNITNTLGVNSYSYGIGGFVTGIGSASAIDMQFGCGPGVTYFYGYGVTLNSPVAATTTLTLDGQSCDGGGVFGQYAASPEGIPQKYVSINGAGGPQYFGYANAVGYNPATTGNWHAPPGVPTTIQQALDNLTTVLPGLNEPTTTGQVPIYNSGTGVVSWGSAGGAVTLTGDTVGTGTGTIATTTEQCSGSAGVCTIPNGTSIDVATTGIASSTAGRVNYAEGVSATCYEAFRNNANTADICAVGSDGTGRAIFGSETASQNQYSVLSSYIGSELLSFGFTTSAQEGQNFVLSSNQNDCLGACNGSGAVGARETPNAGTFPSSYPATGDTYADEASYGTHIIEQAGSGSAGADWLIAPIWQGTSAGQAQKVYDFGGYATTSSASAVTAVTIPVASRTFTGTVTCSASCDAGTGCTTAGDMFMQTSQLCYRVVSGTLGPCSSSGLVSVATASDTLMSTCAISTSVSGTNLLVQVAGLASSTIHWTCTVTQGIYN